MENENIYITIIVRYLFTDASLHITLISFLCILNFFLVVFTTVLKFLMNSKIFSNKRECIIQFLFFVEILAENFLQCDILKQFFENHCFYLKLKKSLDSYSNWPYLLKKKKKIISNLIKHYRILKKIKQSQ